MAHLQPDCPPSLSPHWQGRRSGTVIPLTFVVPLPLPPGSGGGGRRGPSAGQLSSRLPAGGRGSAKAVASLDGSVFPSLQQFHLDP